MMLFKAVMGNLESEFALLGTEIIKINKDLKSNTLQKIFKKLNSL